MTDADALPQESDALILLQLHADDLERRLLDSEAASADRLLQADLKIAALSAGMLDLDGLKMLDTATLAFGIDGQVMDLPQTMARLRREKPWLFSATTTSSVAAAPSSSPPRRKMAADMTLEEWRAARAELLRRR